MKIVHVLLFTCLISLSTPAIAKRVDFSKYLHRVLIVSADYVRLRDKPSDDGKIITYLFKNSVVRTRYDKKYKHSVFWDFNSIKVRSRTKWIPVAYGRYKGFVHTKYVSHAPKQNVNPYTAPADMKWFYKRYGKTINYHNIEKRGLNIDSFTLDEYRKILSSAVKQDGTTGDFMARVIIQKIMLPYVNKYPNAPISIFLKPKLHSISYIARLFGKTPIDDFIALQNIPKHLSNNKYLYMLMVTHNAKLISRLPVKWKSNREVAAIAIIQNPMYITYFASHIKKDKKIFSLALLSLASKKHKERCKTLNQLRTTYSRIHPELFTMIPVHDMMLRCGYQKTYRYRNGVYSIAH